MSRLVGHGTLWDAMSDACCPPCMAWQAQFAPAQWLATSHPAPQGVHSLMRPSRKAWGVVDSTTWSAVKPWAGSLKPGGTSSQRPPVLPVLRVPSTLQGRRGRRVGGGAVLFSVKVHPALAAPLRLAARCGPATSVLGVARLTLAPPGRHHRCRLTSRRTPLQPAPQAPADLACRWCAPSNECSRRCSSGSAEVACRAERA